ncbi:energy transducer TonB [Lysobacter sp. TY2-98]|uniref:energy transducer TonB n=1 Tax=Lysobacter sp. TY2-98 TaxID=2290922 RepID=UPI0013B440A0|nr:energy transducer TonB [Lysobacter sp. TY2-98]
MPSLRNEMLVVGLALLATSTAVGAGPQSETAGRMSKAEIDRLNKTLAASSSGADTAPVLVEGYRPIYPAPRVVKGDQGRCVVRFTVDEKGAVTSPKPEGDDKMMCDHAVIAMRYWRFSPAERNGVPTTADLTLPVIYKIR